MSSSESQTNLHPDAVDVKAPIKYAPSQITHLVDREQIGVFTARTGNVSVSQKSERNHLRGPVGVPQRPKKLLQSFPRKVSNIYHRTLRKRNKDDARPHVSNKEYADPAPLLAPPPPRSNANTRLGRDLEEKSQMPPVGEFIKNPLEAVKAALQHRGEDEFAQNIGKSAVNHGADVALVLEHARVAETQANAEAEAGAETAEEIEGDNDGHPSSDEEGEDVLNGLKQSRQDFFTRWTIDRHVRNVGRIRPYTTVLQGRKEFMHHNDQGRLEMDWMKYGQHMWQYALENCTPAIIEAEAEGAEAGSEFPNPSRELMVSSLERMIVSSRPLQRMFVYMRRISRWENPLESGVYMFAYFTLLVSGCLPQAIISLIIFKVIYRRLCPPTIGDMRPRLVQAEDKSQQAEDLSELITKHGPHGWVDRFIEMAGPMLLYHTEGFADTLEVIHNFYQWRDPRETTSCLLRLTCILALCTFLPTWLLVKGLLGLCGLLFFAATPVSVLFPDYRALTSPSAWIFRRIPTHADWAIARLREEARQQMSIIQKDQAPERGSKADEEAEDQNEHEADQTVAAAAAVVIEQDVTPIHIGSYKCRDVHRGRLLLTNSTASFLPSRSAAAPDGSGGVKWSVAYTTLKGIHKKSSTTSTRKGSQTVQESLLFVDEEDVHYEVTGLKSRDLVFSQIIGYSDVLWRKVE